MGVICFLRGRSGTYSLKSTLAVLFMLRQIIHSLSDPVEIIISACLSYHKFPFCLKFKGCGF